MEKSHEKIAQLILKSENIVVFTGAGISTGAGIPDFRSPTGLYRLIDKKYKPPYPEAVFDIGYFQKNPQPFYSLSAKLLGNESKPTLCHKFIAWLEEIGKISLVMTQNIDCLHSEAGSKRVLECHGSYSVSHCLKCGKEYDSGEMRRHILAEEVPRCQCGGLAKPDIVFFGEGLPDEFYHYMRKPPRADLILILGTSLKVFPSARFAIDLAKKVPSVLVNLEPTDYDGLMTYCFHENLESFAKTVWNLLQD